MATWLPISGSVVQRIKSDGKPAVGYVLKFYAAGTSSNIPLATDSTGTTQANYAVYDSNGDLAVSGAPIIPHISESYKLAIYPSQASADADSGAVLTIDNQTISNFSRTASVTDANNSGITSPLSLTHGTTGTPSSGIGTGIELRTDTADGVTKTGAVIASVAEDVASGSEDFRLIVKLMTGGATVAEVLRLSSTGIFYASGQTQWNKGADVASAALLSVGDDGNYFDVTGTVSITSIDTKKIGTIIKLHFDDALTLTHHATDLILPGSANITTAAGDEAEFVEYASGDWRCTNYSKATGEALAANLINDESPQLGGPLDCNSHQVQWSKGADVASAAALPVLTDGNYFDVTGTAAITSINTTKVGNIIKLHFDGALTLTHHATNLILPGGVSITTAAGDEAEFIEYATGAYRCTNYSKASGKAVVVDASATVLLSVADASNDTSIDFTGIDSTYDEYELHILNAIPATDNTRAQFLYSNDNGSTFEVTGYDWTKGVTAGAGVVVDSGTNDSFIELTENMGSAANEVGFSGVIRIIRPSDATYTEMTWLGSYVTGATSYPRHIHGAAHRDTAEAVDAIRFNFAAGNVESGKFALYGVSRS